MAEADPQRGVPRDHGGRPTIFGEEAGRLAMTALLDDAAIAELRAFNVEFERRLGSAPPVESVPPAESRAAAYEGRGTIPAPEFLPQARGLIIPGPRGRDPAAGARPRRGERNLPASARRRLGARRVRPAGRVAVEARPGDRALRRQRRLPACPRGSVPGGTGRLRGRGRLAARSWAGAARCAAGVRDRRRVGRRKPVGRDAAAAARPACDHRHLLRRGPAVERGCPRSFKPDRRPSARPSTNWSASSSDSSCAPSPTASRRSVRPSALGSQRRRSRSGGYW
jgi:hypothetical protein